LREGSRCIRAEPLQYQRQSDDRCFRHPVIEDVQTIQAILRMNAVAIHPGISREYLLNKKRLNKCKQLKNETKEKHDSQS
jgi:hypothetical protein